MKSSVRVRVHEDLRSGGSSFALRLRFDDGRQITFFRLLEDSGSRGSSLALGLRFGGLRDEITAIESFLGDLSHEASA